MSHLSQWNSQVCLLDLSEFCIYFQNDFVYHTFYNDIQMLGKNSYHSCVAMSFHIQNTFCFFFIWFNSIIYIFWLLLQLQLNFVNLSHLLKFSLEKIVWMTIKNYLIFHFTISTNKTTSCVLFQSGNNLVNWFVFPLFHLTSIIHSKGSIHSWFKIIFE